MALKIVINFTDDADESDALKIVDSIEENLSDYENVSSINIIDESLLFNTFVEGC